MAESRVPVSLSRTAAVALAGVLAVTRSAVSAPAAAPAADGWPQWRGPARNGHAPALPSDVRALKERWKKPLAGGCNAGVAAAEGVVLVADHDDENDYYRCFDAADGLERWVREFPNGREMDYGAAPRAAPLVHGGRVFVMSAFGELRCLDLKSGQTVWEKDLVEAFEAGEPPHWGYSSSPLIAAGRLIVNPGGRTAVAALDPATGNVAWEGEGSGVNYASFIAGTFGGVEQVVGFDEDSLGGWDAATGKRLWSVDVQTGDGYLVPTPIDFDGKLFVANTPNGARLYRFGAGGAIDEKPVAQSDDLAPDVVTPVAAVNDLVVGSAGGLVCLDAADGLKTLWADRDARPLQEPSHLIAAGGVLLAFNTAGEATLISVDRTGAKVIGTAKLCRPTQSHPAVSGGRLYVRDDEFLYCRSFGGGR